MGLVHPCKIYNILSVGAPVLYIGPRPSHLSEMLDLLNGCHLCVGAAHGEVEKVVEAIQKVRQQSGGAERRIPPQAHSLFAKEAGLGKLLAELEAEKP